MTGGRMRVGYLGSALVMILMSGCAENPSPDPADDAENALGGAPLDVLDVEGHACDAAGAVSLNPEGFGGDDLLPAPFEPADTSPYLGGPSTGYAIGVYHSAFACESWMIDGRHDHVASGGFVGILVKPPRFDEVEPVEHNLLASTISTRNQNVTDFFQRHGLYVYPGLGHVESIDEGDPWTVRAVLATAGDGTYESILNLQARGPVWPTLRIWLIVQGADEALHPAYLDVLQTGGETYIGPGEFFHHGAGDHIGGTTTGPTGGLGFRGFDFTFRFGMLEATMEEMWDH